MSINMGLTDDQRTAMANAVTAVLADTYALYFKTHVYHWNVTGPRFHDLHLLFEQQYNELWLATDDIAERVRALDFKAPASYAAMAAAATVNSEGKAQKADVMIADLLRGHEAVVATIRKALELAAEHGDDATADVLSPRLTTHEKYAWMLRSTLG
ncbi:MULTISPECIES: Dps family protein [Maricaulis]|uniref:Starvation-inducible DNA-binding protein n=1 Tax=Maricaulis salignorans TaxID=144026 RepID=A0A1G9RNK6_9PROT|nr:Dps family protein [Maricaulis salignorans]SDM24868.1 starvation-inducible DNA-binding protein [Maricaulis salignorans]|tara:strand:+ start:1453 stop:1920 length:468 start_codon:yes stop_codon:yes gene_type:complete